MSSSSLESDESLQRLRDLVEAVNVEDYERVAVLCTDLLEGRSTASTEALHTAIHETHVYALLQLQKYDDVMATVIDSTTNSATTTDRLNALQAYAAYKQKNYRRAVMLASKQNDDLPKKSAQIMALQHVRAQAFYHLADAASAVQAYTELMDSCTNDEEKIQVYTNVMAVWNANAIPYCSFQETADHQKEEVVANVSNFLQEKSAEEYPYDLAYNLATLMLSTTSRASDRVPWLRLMQTAAEACRSMVGDGELAAEIGPIATNELLFRRTFWNMTGSSSDWQLSDDDGDLGKATANGSVGDGSTTSPTAAWQTVRQVNCALARSPAEALRVLTAEPDWTKLSVLQRRIWLYNRALMQLQAGKWDDCRVTCQHFLSLPKGKKKKSTEQNEAVVDSSPEARLFWESRVSVLLAHCAVKEGGGNATAILDACMVQCQGLPSSSVRNHTLTYLLLHRAALTGVNSVDAKIKVLTELHDTIGNKPAVVATMAALFHAAGSETKAAELLQSVDDDQVVAEFAMSQANYQYAAELYERSAAASDDPVVKARWIRALSYTDPEKAVQLWSEMSPDLVVSDDDDDGVNGAELEVKELRLKSTMVRRTSDGLATTVDATKKSKKSHAAVLRRRARKRETYLAELAKKGASPLVAAVPDPERWIPKYERSNARRRKNRGPHHKGAQGGVSEKDAAKLDVVARQAARASGETDPASRSTAHLTVSGGGRKAKSSSSKRR